MTDQNASPSNGDRAADLTAIMVIFVCLVLTAVHFVSGFTFDF